MAAQRSQFCCLQIFEEQVGILATARLENCDVIQNVDHCKPRKF